MDVQALPIAALIPAGYNPRRMSKHDAEALKRSLSEYGAVEPAVVNADNTIIGGHMRVQAAKQLGWTEFPVVRVDLPDDKAKLLNLALNRISGEWDEGLLEEMIYGLHQSESDLALSGFDSKELDTLLAAVGIGGPEEGPIPEPPAEPITRPGDLWLLGPHRLLCGDATKREDVERLMGGATSDLLLTDPPYGIDLLGNEGGRVGGGTREYPTREFAAIIGDNKSFDPRPLLGVAPRIIIWGGNYFAHLLPASRCWFVWDKQHPVDRTFAGCELAWTNLSTHAKIYYSTWDGWTKEGEDGSKQHPTQKPLKLMSEVIQDSSTAGELILDFYLGSGTTLIAAHQLGRVCYGLEIEPGYVDVAVKRWENLTGERATRERAEVAV